jgi:hypothetical protein
MEVRFCFYVTRASSQLTLVPCSWKLSRCAVDENGLAGLPRCRSEGAAVKRYRMMWLNPMHKPISNPHFACPPHLRLVECCM